MRPFGFSFLRILSYLLKKSLMENFIFCAVVTTLQRAISQKILKIKTFLANFGHFPPPP